MPLYRGLKDITDEVDALQLGSRTGGESAWASRMNTLSNIEWPYVQNYSQRFNPTPLELSLIDPRQKSAQLGMEGYFPKSSLGGVALGSLERTPNLEGYNPNTLTEQDILSRQNSLGMEGYFPNSSYAPYEERIQDSVELYSREPQYIGMQETGVEKTTDYDLSGQEKLKKSNIQNLVPQENDTIKILLAKLKQLAYNYMLEAPTNIGQGRWRESELDTTRNYYNPQPNEGYPVGV